MSGSQENLGKQDGEIGSTSNLLERLTLQEDEADDLIWEEELDAEEIKPKWLALGRLLTTKTYSHSALIAYLRAPWNPALKGPWDFKGYAVILAEYDGFTNPEKVRLDNLETWAQIHKLPDGVLKSEKALGNLAQRVGEVQEVQVTLPDGFVGPK
ncbi:reverse transcriptase [Hordeum vulgare]|nr:reverse transcriptase [Hordeum vulgare]